MIFYENQVILIVIEISDLNQADLNRPTLCTKQQIQKFLKLLRHN